MVNDKAFIQSANSLKKNLTLMHAFFPLIIIIIILIGYVASYLMMQNRRQELAVMRSLGTSRKSCEALLSIENLILVLSGCIVGVITATFFIRIGILESFAIAMVFLVSYMSGAFFAVHIQGKLSVMEVLTKTE
jgi:ABC-type antimicrobial peptide transport system permease subunit